MRASEQAAELPRKLCRQPDDPRICPSARRDDRGAGTDAIRKQGENAETVYTCYVVERNRLEGRCFCPCLLASEPHTPLVRIMDDNVVTVKVTDDQEYVAREMQRYDFTAMPVLDNEGMSVGIITIDDAIDVLTDESTGGYAEDGCYSAGRRMPPPFPAPASGPTRSSASHGC